MLLNYSCELFRARFVLRLWMRRIITAVSNQKLLELEFAFCVDELAEIHQPRLFRARLIPRCRNKNQCKKRFFERVIIKKLKLKI
ncbi:MAG: hypothetical protein M3367_04720 [Acidobacteriota bacterium]|nr:hypothetical protein [Acidobacteriota bacterium]